MEAEREYHGSKPMPKAQHGTNGGYGKHQRVRSGEWGWPACEPCMTAMREYNQTGSRKRWEPDEIALLDSDLTNHEIAEKIGRTHKAVQRKRWLRQR
jgi:hypothetical protein